MSIGRSFGSYRGKLNALFRETRAEAGLPAALEYPLIRECHIGTMDEVREIARLYVEKLRKTMERQGKIVEITDAAIDLLTEKGFSPAYGARFLKRHIDQKVKLPITNDWKAATKFVVDAKEGDVAVKTAEVFSLN